MKKNRLLIAAAIGLSLAAIFPLASAQGGPLTLGNYQCTAAGGIAGKLKIKITGSSQYADGNGKPGSYMYDPKSNLIEFKSGPWAGNFGKKLGPRKIGITSRRGGSANTICDLK
ncbi:MAG: hypothetical protein HYS18_07720 [Burkholderiales bacterium]|nr:hypothetical protein [Burkholderiales bacterium]